MNDCARLGFISNICIDIACGRIISFSVKDCSGFFSGRNREVNVPWENVKKIGEDIIFVDICVTSPPPQPPKKKLFPL